MSTKTLRILCCFLCLALVPCARSLAQEGGDHDRDRPGGPGGPGGLGGPGGPNAPNHHDRPKQPRHSDHSDKAQPTQAQAAPHNALQFGPVGRWWDNRTVIQSVGLRREQQMRMDSIFHANKPAIEQNYKVFLKAQSDLAAVNKDPKINKDQLFAAIDAVNQARASLQKATSSMLLQMKQELDPDQINKLENMQ